MSTGHSLKLTVENDLTIDGYGNIACCTLDEAVAQDVACTLRLFKDDAWYYPERGLDHFSTTLGIKPTASLVRTRFARAARQVPGVAAATVTDISIDDHRNLNCSVVVQTTNGGIKQIDI